MSDSTESSAYFYRIITLVVDVGTETLRDLFYSFVPKKDVATLFSSTSVKAELDRLKRKSVLSNDQYQQVTVNPDPDKYDITLLLILLTNQKIFKVSPPSSGWGASPADTDVSLGADLLRLRHIRNELVGHRPNTLLTSSDFRKNWGEIETVLRRIAAAVNSVEEPKIKEKIKDAEMRILEPLNDREEKLLQVFLRWRKEEDDKNQAKLADVQQSLESLHLKVDGISTTSRDETDATRTDDTLSSLESQVLSIAQNIGSVAQQEALQEIHQNVQSMKDVIDTLYQTVRDLQRQLNEKQAENAQFLEEIKHLRQKPGNRTQVLYKRQQTQPKPKSTNPNAMTEKEIHELSRQIGYEWEQLRIYLDFTEAQLHALKKAYDDDVQQRIHVMLKAWHDVVVECGENPKMLLAAAFVSASTNYSMAYKLVSQESFDENATARESTVKRIQQITFRKSGHDTDYVDGCYQTGWESPLGGHGAVNVYGGNLRIEGPLSIHNSSSSLSSDASLVTSDGYGGAGSQSTNMGSFNIYDGDVVMGAGSKVVTGPPVSRYNTSQSHTPHVRGERLDSTDLGSSSLSRSESSGQPFKKENDDTLSQTMVAALNEQMKSVGALISHGNVIGTVFRVGSHYVMTALHVVRVVIDPGCSGDFDYACLESETTYVNFNESVVGAPVIQYRLKKDFIYNYELDVAVLEISNTASLPRKMNLHKPTPSGSRITNVSLIGYGHKFHAKKCLDPKCEILAPASQRIQSAFAWLQQNFEYYRTVLRQTGQDPYLVDCGYAGYDHPAKIVFDCFMEHGGSGGPALTNDNERSVKVYGMLTHGLPEFFYRLPEEFQTGFPVKYRVELGTKMTSIYEWIKATQAEELVKDLFN